MKRKAILILLLGALALCFYGCAEDEPDVEGVPEGAVTTTEEPEGTIQPVPDAGTPETAQGTMTQERTEYVQGAEQLLNGIEQKLTAIQQQAGTAGQEGQQQVQELTKQVQEQLADARAAVDKMRNASGTELKEAKVAADMAIQDVQEAFKNLQTQVGTQVTQVQ